MMGENQTLVESSARAHKIEDLFCEDCLKDPEIQCKRDRDVMCLQCGRELCGFHIKRHLEEEHQISTTWRGRGASEQPTRRIRTARLSP